MAVAPSPARQFCKLFYLRHAGRHKGRLEDEVFRRITGDEQFREYQQVCPGLRRCAMGLTGKPRIAGQRTDRWIELGQHDFEFVNHVALLDFCGFCSNVWFKVCAYRD
jgi:hypothetical protein